MGSLVLNPCGLLPSRQPNDPIMAMMATVATCPPSMRNRLMGHDLSQI